MCTSMPTTKLRHACLPNNAHTYICTNTCICMDAHEYTCIHTYMDAPKAYAATRTHAYVGVPAKDGRSGSHREDIGHHMFDGMCVHRSYSKGRLEVVVQLVHSSCSAQTSTPQYREHPSSTPQHIHRAHSTTENMAQGIKRPCTSTTRAV